MDALISVLRVHGFCFLSSQHNVPWFDNGCAGAWPGLSRHLDYSRSVP